MIAPIPGTMRKSARPIELDPARAERLREESAYRANVRTDPLTRLVVFLALAAAVGMHNRFILDEFSWESFIPVVLTFVVYSTLSWLVIFLFHEQHPQLGLALLYSDVALLTYAIYASGGDRSLLFFLPVVRVADQTHTSFRRAMLLGHVSLAAYAGLMLWLALQGRDIDPGREAVKFALLWAAVLYIAAVARAADNKRARMTAAISLARDSVTLNERIMACAGESIVGVGLDERIIFANARAATVLGRTIDELIGSGAHDIAPHFAADGISTCDGTDCTLAAAIRSGREERGEHPGFIQVDGSAIPVQYISAPLLEAGRVTGAVFSFRDVTEQKLARQALIAAKTAAEQANLAKSRLLANMSHELRTPLNAVIGYSEMIADELADSERSDLVPDVQRIRSSGQKLLGIINDLLEVAKIEAGRTDLTIEEFDVEDLAQEIETAARKDVERKGNRLTVVCSDSGRANADVVKVRKIIGNLLNNANKFTENGEITLRIGRSLDRGPDRILFEVSDTGVGMTDEQADNLFQPFRQGDMTATRRHGGTGLGLAIARGLTQLMGGHCSVRSKPGAGSTFTIDLPADVADATGVAPDPDTSREIA
jgi:PAS domain S-box-containing protein